jgi:hypothetical protein
MPFVPVTVAELASEVELVIDSAIDAREDWGFCCLRFGTGESGGRLPVTVVPESVLILVLALRPDVDVL